MVNMAIGGFQWPILSWLLLPCYFFVFFVQIFVSLAIPISKMYRTSFERYLISIRT
jgi:hypothetical protein